VATFALVAAVMGPLVNVISVSVVSAHGKMQKGARPPQLWPSSLATPLIQRCAAGFRSTGQRRAPAVPRPARSTYSILSAPALVCGRLVAVPPQLAVGLSKLQGAYTIDYPVIMAGAAMAAIPVLILYIFVQRYVIEGVASSGIKG
jgi:hypothetical protein